MFEKAKMQENGVWRAIGYVYGRKIEIKSKYKNYNFFYEILSAIENEANNYTDRASKKPTLTMPFQILCNFYEGKKVRIYTNTSSDDNFITGVVQSITVKEILLIFSFTNGKEIAVTLLHRIEILE